MGTTYRLRDIQSGAQAEVSTIKAEADAKVSEILNEARDAQKKMSRSTALHKLKRTLKPACCAPTGPNTPYRTPLSLWPRLRVKPEPPSIKWGHSAFAGALTFRTCRGKSDEPLREGTLWGNLQYGLEDGLVSLAPGEKTRPAARRRPVGGGGGRGSRPFESAPGAAPL